MCSINNVKYYSEKQQQLKEYHFLQLLLKSMQRCWFLKIFYLLTVLLNKSEKYIMSGVIII